MNVSWSQKNTSAGVIVLHDMSSDCLILTKRPVHLRDHPGEICFPGGKWEAGDKDLYATALRELKEELSIEPARIQLIKNLSVVPTLLGVVIHPWFGYIESLIPYKLNVEEVASLIYIPFALAGDRANYKQISIMKHGRAISTYCFTAHTEFVWGATAKIMRQFILP